MSTPLYTREILGLAVALADYPLFPDSGFHSEQISRTCGSRVSVALDVRGGTIARIGVRAQACAIGQASAALLAQNAVGKCPADVRHTYRALREWLDGQAPPPEWLGLNVLEPVLAHPGRHEALLLPWKAADAALFMSAADS